MAGTKHITNNLLDNDVDLLYKGRAISTIQDLGSILFVTPNGNDALALRGRIDRPYKTVNAALEAAYGGDTVKVLPGTYNENITLVNTYKGYQPPVTLDISGKVTITSGTGWVFNNPGVQWRLNIVGDSQSSISRTGSTEGGAIYDFASAFYVYGVGNISSTATAGTNSYTLLSGYGLGTYEKCTIIGSGAYTVYANHGMEGFFDCIIKNTVGGGLFGYYRGCERIENCTIETLSDCVNQGGALADANRELFFIDNRLKSTAGRGFYISHIHTSKCSIWGNQVQSHSTPLQTVGYYNASSVVEQFIGKYDIHNNSLKAGAGATYSMQLATNANAYRDQFVLCNNIYNKDFQLLGTRISENNNQLVPDLF